MKKQVIFYIASNTDRLIFNDEHYRRSYNSPEEADANKLCEDSKVVKVIYEWEEGE